MNDQVRFLSTEPVKSTCPYCGVGCGVLARPGDDGMVVIEGDREHPANYGRLCSKGTHLGDTVHLNERLLAPMIDGEVSDWDTALDLIAGRFQALLETDGPSSIAMYVSGQLLTEDYYAANKFMKGCIGSANIDTNSRLCMSSTVAGQKRAFGSDTVPNCYDDFELADLVVLVGSNLAWCHPILYQRLEAIRQKRPEMTMVTIDPRATVTARAGDVHIALKPGSDVALFNGLLAFLADEGFLDQDYINAHVDNADEALEVARALSLEEIANITGLERQEIISFYELFGRTDKVLSLFSQGVNQSSAGTDKVNAILNCHLMTGRIGRPGSGPFSLTGQPNAMGGREVGGLANQLACHMALENEDDRALVGRFWGSDVIPDKPGLMAVDLFKAVESGQVKAIWIMATNPVDSLPEADVVRAALEACPLVVVSDVSRLTDTVAVGDVLLPSAAWGEKSGTVTNSERRISRQHAFLGLPGLARPDWWQIGEVARRMGFAAAFPFQSPFEIFAEYADLSAFENEGLRDFDLSGLVNLSEKAYDQVFPVQWPCKARKHLSFEETQRLFADGGFFRANGKAMAVPTPYKLPASSVSDRFPYLLNTGRIRDQWHTMTRTAKSNKLMRHIGEPFLEINPVDALALQISDAEIVRVESEQGFVLLRARLSDAVPAGTVFAPMHWSDQYASRARVDTLVASHRDDISGQPESKITPVALQPFGSQSYGFALSTVRPKVENLRLFASNDEFYWALYRLETGFALELAGKDLESLDDGWLNAILGLDDVYQYQMSEVVDIEKRFSRRAYFRDHIFEAMIAVGPEPVALSRSYLTGCLGQLCESGPEKINLLFGRPGPDQPEKGRIICSCLNVGELEINRAIEAGSHSIQAVGDACGAGTNCGSCRSEISRLLVSAPKQLVTEQEE